MQARNETSLNFSQFIKEGKILDLHCNDINDNDIPAILDFLVNHKEITILNVSSNDIGDVGAAALAKNQTIKTLYVDTCNIMDRGAVALAKNQTIKVLTLDNSDWKSSGNISDIGAEAFSKNQVVTTLVVSGNKVSYKGQALVSAIVERNKASDRITAISNMETKEIKSSTPPISDFFKSIESKETKLKPSLDTVTQKNFKI